MIKFMKWAIGLGAVLGIFICLGSWYVVDQDEKAVLLTWGVYTETTGPGLQWKLPWPFQTVMKEKVTHIRRIEIGFRSPEQGAVDAAGAPAQVDDFKQNPKLLEEAQMLTGDENIVDVEIVVQYEINSLKDWLFNSKNPDELLRMAAESAERQVVGDRSIDGVLVLQRTEISAEIRDRIENIIKPYGLGVHVNKVQMQEALPPTEVSAAFKDVATAKEVCAMKLNEAAGYKNEKLQEAAGTASRTKFDAEGYSSERTLHAKGEADRFQRIAAEFAKNPDILKERMYLETLQKVLPKMKKIFIDKDINLLNMNNVSANKIEGVGR